MPRSTKRTLTAAVAVLGLVLVGCRSYDGPQEASVVRAPTTTLPPTTVAATTTTVVPVTVAPTPGVSVAPLPGLQRGSSGPEVMALEQKLAALHYDVGKVDGVFDAATHHAVMAFQKVQGLDRTARATPEVVTALATAGPAAAMLAEGGADRVEIDLKRQVLLLWQGGNLVRALSVSTGTGKRYCVDGQCAKAVTPGGSFKVVRKIKGLRVSRLGQLYNPLYFNGGIAIHGSGSVPAGPASHGCVRIPMVSSRWFHDTVPIGTPVYVIGGARAPVPFNEQTPTDGVGDASTTTTTAVTVPVVDTTTTTTATTVPLLGTLPTLPLGSGTTTTTTTTTPTTVPAPVP